MFYCHVSRIAPSALLHLKGFPPSTFAFPASSTAIMSSLQQTIFAFLFPGSAAVNSLLATAYISIFPNLLLYFVPPDIDTSSLNTLVAFAVGGLLGDVFLHLMPHAFMGEHHGDQATIVVDEKKNVVIGMGIFIGLTFFFIMDKGMRVFNGGGGGHSHGHTHTHEHAHADHNHDSHDHSHSEKPNAEDSSSSLRQRKPDSSSSSSDVTPPAPASVEPSNSIKLSAYLNLFADATHNFTDGLAMAASFYASPGVGATTAVAVFFHEIPHEVGDYAILIQSGFSKQKAMMAQFTTAVGAFLGTLAGIAIEEASRSGAHEKHNLEVAGILGTGVTLGDMVIPFTAGGFIYIATVGVIPELLEVTGGFRKDIRQMATELVALMVGVGMMSVIAWNEATAGDY